MTDTILDYLTPASIGLSGFEQFRTIQLEAIEEAVYSEDRVVGLACPTGSGKSVIAAGVAKLTGQRTIILTSTKGLQEQYISDFGRDGLVDIRGRANYSCPVFGDCRTGAAMGCGVDKGLCTYDQAKDKARNAQWVVSNYDFWININDRAQGLERLEDDAAWMGNNPFEILILDEGHDAAKKVESYLSCRMYENELARFIEPANLGEDLGEWSQFCRGILEEIKADIRTAKMEAGFLIKNGQRSKAEKVIEITRRLEGLLDKAWKIAFAEPGEWVAELTVGTKYGRVWDFDVVWPGRYTEQYLLCHVPKVIVMSATLRPKTMGLLGLRREDYKFREWPRIFPPNRAPIYHMPAAKKNAKGETVGINIKHGMADEDKVKWVEQIDSIIEHHLDRKGVIHTVAYAHQEYIAEHSRYRHLMVGNTKDPDSDTAAEAFEKFKKMKPPAVLISPSFSTGWDFKGELAEYQIIAKLPFPPQQSKVMRARNERDKQYSAYLTMQELIQAIGRGQRTETDRCSNWIVDGTLTFFMIQNKGLAPSWFLGAIKRVNQVTVMEKLKDGH